MHPVRQNTWTPLHSHSELSLSEQATGHQKNPRSTEGRCFHETGPKESSEESLFVKDTPEILEPNSHPWVEEIRVKINPLLAQPCHIDGAEAESIM